MNRPRFTLRSAFAWMTLVAIGLGINQLGISVFDTLLVIAAILAVIGVSAQLIDLLSGWRTHVSDIVARATLIVATTTTHVLFVLDRTTEIRVGDWVEGYTSVRAFGCLTLLFLLLLGKRLRPLVPRSMLRRVLGTAVSVVAFVVVGAIVVIAGSPLITGLVYIAVVGIRQSHPYRLVGTHEPLYDHVGLAAAKAEFIQYSAWSSLVVVVTLGSTLMLASRLKAQTNRVRTWGWLSVYGVSVGIGVSYLAWLYLDGIEAMSPEFGEALAWPTPMSATLIAGLVGTFSIAMSYQWARHMERQRESTIHLRRLNANYYHEGYLCPSLALVACAWRLTRDLDMFGFHFLGYPQGIIDLAVTFTAASCLWRRWRRTTTDFGSQGVTLSCKRLACASVVIFIATLLCCQMAIWIFMALYISPYVL